MQGLRGEVLVVEDDPDVRLVIADVLRHEGFRVVTAEDGQEALDLLHAGAVKPLALLVDLLLPRLDGEDLLHTARASVPGFSDLPVLVMSGTLDVAARCASLSVRGFLQKPFGIDELIGLLCAVTHPRGEHARQVLGRRLLRYLGCHGELSALRRALAEEDFVSVESIAASIALTGRDFGEPALEVAGEAIAAAAARHNQIAVLTAVRGLANVVLQLQVRR